MPYANNKGADQPAHPRSLITAFVVHCLDRIIPLYSKSKISSLYLVSVVEQARLSLTWLQTIKTGFLVTYYFIRPLNPIISPIRHVMLVCLNIQDHYSTYHKDIPDSV